MNEIYKNSVLIVDDQQLNITALKKILSPDYTVYTADNGEDAIEIAEKHLPDIILLDIVMPHMNGYAVLAALKGSAKTQGIPVIFITALNNTGDEEKGLDQGAVDYITKPFSAAIVQARVKNQIILYGKLRTIEYDIMKYKLANDALNIALWDMAVVNEDPANPNNKFTWSQEFREILGFSGESDFPNLLSSCSDRLHPEDKERMLTAFAEHVSDHSGKTPYNLEYRIMAKNGEYRHFHAFGNTLRDIGGIPVRVAGAIRDITEQKQAEEALKIVREEIRKAEIAEESNKAKSRVLATISHEIKTPMNSIMGFTELALATPENDIPPQLREYFSKIKDNTKLLLHFVNEILDISKMESGQIDYEYVPVFAKHDTVEKPHFDGIILICEDNSMNQQVICEHLAQIGLKTVIAENGKLGVEMVEERIKKNEAPFDLIFMDMFMPVMDGLEAASKIASLNTKTPIVAVTANTMAAELENYKKHGMLDTLGKPFTTQDLWRVLLKYLTPVGKGDGSGLGGQSLGEDGALTGNADLGAAPSETSDSFEDELMRKLKVSFYKNNQTKFDEITDAIEAGDIKLAHRLTHSLKGNAGMIGEAKLQSAAAKVESELKQAINSETSVASVPDSMMATLKTELTSVLDELRSSQEQTTQNPALPELDPEKTLELFVKLAQMLENLNPESGFLLDELRTIPGTEDLALMIENYDFESASKALAELMKSYT